MQEPKAHELCARGTPGRAPRLCLGTAAVRCIRAGQERGREEAEGSMGSSSNKSDFVWFGSAGTKVQEHKNKPRVKVKNWGTGGQTHHAESENLLSSRTAAAGCAPAITASLGKRWKSRSLTHGIPGISWSKCEYPSGH